MDPSCSSRRPRRGGRLLRPLPLALLLSGLLHALSIAGAVRAAGGPGTDTGALGAPSDSEPTFDVDLVATTDPSSPLTVPPSAVDEAQTDDPEAAQGPSRPNERPRSNDSAASVATLAPEPADPTRPARSDPATPAFQNEPHEDRPRTRLDRPSPGDETTTDDDTDSTRGDEGERGVTAHAAAGPTNRRGTLPADATAPDESVTPRPGATGVDAPPVRSGVVAGLPSEGAEPQPAGAAGDRAADRAGTPGASGGGGRKGIRPDLFERFNHDLPSVAYGVAGWGDCGSGDEVALVVALELGADGTLVSCPLGAPGAAPCRPTWRVEGDDACRGSDPLGESVRRTIGGLYGRFQLPDARSSPGRLTLRVTASVGAGEIGAAGKASASDPPVIVGSTPRVGNEATGHFQRQGGRRIDFAVQLLRVEGAPAARAETGSR